MWDRYKKAFVGVEAAAALVAAAAYLFSGQDWRTAGTWFLVVQFAAVTGAVWAARIRSMTGRPASALVRPRRA